MREASSDTEEALTSILAGELRVVIGKLSRRLREQGQLGDLTWSQVLVLGRLERDGPTTVTNLAHAEGMRPQSMGAIVSVLESSGFVSGSPDPGDGRQTILTVTSAGREWIKAHRAARQDWLFHELQTHLAAKDQEELSKALPLLKRLVEGTRPSKGNS